MAKEGRRKKEVSQIVKNTMAERSKEGSTLMYRRMESSKNDTAWKYVVKEEQGTEDVDNNNVFVGDGARNEEEVEAEDDDNDYVEKHEDGKDDYVSGGRICNRVPYTDEEVL